MANRLPREKKLSILHHLIEGNTLRSTSRLTGVHRTTIMSHMVKFGEACQRLMDGELRNLTLGHVECDEIWTFVKKKQSRLTIQEREERGDIGDIYVWTAVDNVTKLLVSHIVGKRSADNARRLMVDLRSRITLPRPHEADITGEYRKVLQISTDGLAAYPEAVDLAFGPYVKFGTIIKDYRNANMPYTPSEMIGTQRRGVFGIRGDSEERTICTSHGERHNLTIRTLMKRFTRLSLGFSKKLENLEAGVAMFMAYYNWVWRTRYPDDSGQAGRLRPTAAMMSKVTDRLWSFEDLYDAAMAA